FEQARQLRHDSLLKAGIIHRKADTVIEINTADTNSLQYIRGIGKYSAVQIIRYRQQLGGYHSLEQLREIDNLDYMAWDSVMPHLRIDTTLISKINVQTASVERLMHHPYISFTQAKKLYEKRRRNIRLKDMDELVPAVFTNEEAGRIKPYLDFTPPPKPSRR
ncbi:MAG: helix-hairpin-helix domain-containing protein, partial [Paludibacteraceae bacterium]|nr:helix-hairpin-helix domain-containing protein [Paludibacteraceae bacterium]